MCVFTAAMFASAIGSTAVRAADNKYAGIHTVEVISALGDDTNKNVGRHRPVLDQLASETK